MHGGKLVEVARRIAELLAQQPELRQAEIAQKLREHDSTVMRALTHMDELGLRLAEDDQGRLSLAE
jgi:DNA-binding IclR family transcriptional regulator